MYSDSEQDSDLGDEKTGLAETGEACSGGGPRESRV